MRTNQKKEIAKYVADMLKQGHTVEAVKKQLEDHGYTKKIIEETFIEHSSKAVRENAGKSVKDEDDSLSAGEKIFILCYGVALLLFIVWTGLMTESSVLVIFVSFIPSIVTVLATYIMYQDSKKRYKNFA